MRTTTTPLRLFDGVYDWKYGLMTIKLPPEDKQTLQNDLDRLEANGMALYQCKECEMVLMLAETTSGVAECWCPHCHRASLHQWVKKVNVSFVPETL